MNTLRTLAFSIIGLFVFATATAGHKIEDDKVTVKAREMVAKASPDDWQTYAKAAAKCVGRNKNMQEAIQWIDKSIAIQPTSMNYSVKGDYFLKNNQKDEAIKWYIKALDLGRSELGFQAEDLQSKLKDLRK